MFEVKTTFPLHITKYDNTYGFRVSNVVSEILVSIDSLIASQYENGFRLRRNNLHNSGVLLAECLRRLDIQSRCYDNSKTILFINITLEAIFINLKS